MRILWKSILAPTDITVMEAWAVPISARIAELLGGRTLIVEGFTTFGTGVSGLLAFKWDLDEFMTNQIIDVHLP